MSETAVSVVIPLFNNRAYVVEAISSALAQTYPIHSVMVVDDGSTDGSADVVEEHFSGNPRVVLLRARHKGRSAARNLGIAKSEANFIAFLDSDDVWQPQKLELQMEVFRDHPEVGCVYCDYRIIDEKGGMVSDACILSPGSRGEVFQRLLEGEPVSGSASAIVVKRSLFTKIGGFDESFDFGEDWDMWLRLARVCEFDFVDRPLTLIRWPASRLTAREPYFTRKNKFTQHMRIWSKWPDDVMRNRRVLRDIRHGILRLYLRPVMSRRRYLAMSRMISRRVLIHLHPDIARVACGSRWPFFFKETNIGWTISLYLLWINIRAFIVRRFPWLKSFKRRMLAYDWIRERRWLL